MGASILCLSEVDAYSGKIRSSNSKGESEMLQTSDRENNAAAVDGLVETNEAARNAHDDAQLTGQDTVGIGVGIPSRHTVEAARKEDGKA